ncbi:MAG: spore coat protein [Clostridia bacterium]|nr:spore coat protein [Clostridia bacterium]
MNQQNQPWNQGNSNTLGDQELAFDLLYQEKSLLSNIASEVLEASQPAMRKVLNDCYMQIGQDQLDIFNQMQQQGWYPVKPAQAQDVQTAKQKYMQTRQTL